MALRKNASLLKLAIKDNEFGEAAAADLRAAWGGRAGELAC